MMTEIPNQERTRVIFSFIFVQICFFLWPWEPPVRGLLVMRINFLRNRSQTTSELPIVNTIYSDQQLDKKFVVEVPIFNIYIATLFSTSSGSMYVYGTSRSLFLALIFALNTSSSFWKSLITRRGVFSLKWSSGYWPRGTWWDEWHIYLFFYFLTLKDLPNRLFAL